MSNLNRNSPGWNTVFSWIDSLSARKTRRDYEEAFSLFWTWALENRLKNDASITESTPDALIRHRLVELKKEAPERFHCEDIVEAYHRTLLDRGLSDGSARRYIAVIRSFYKHATRNGGLDLRIKFKKIRVQQKYVPSLDDIRKVRLQCNPILWSLVATMKDSGLGPDQVSHIKRGQIEKLDGGFWYVTGQRQKTGETFSTFLGPDATKAIEAAYGTITPSIEGRAPVFLNEYKKLFTSSAITQRVQRAIKAAGFKPIERGDQTESFSTYSFRIFFNSALETARVPENWRKRAMGHALGDVQGAYSHPAITELLRTYRDAYKFLSIEIPAQQGMSPEDVADMMHIFATKDKAAFAKFIEAHGDEHPISKLLKRQISASEVEKPARKSKVGDVDRITEAEATNHLNHGWKLLTVLPSGQLLVQYEGEKQ